MTINHKTYGKYLTTAKIPTRSIRKFRSSRIQNPFTKNLNFEVHDLDPNVTELGRDGTTLNHTDI